MAKIIIGTALKVRIRECFHIIRNYQWEYVWTDKEIHQLLEAINNEVRTDRTCV